MLPSTVLDRPNLQQPSTPDDPPLRPQLGVIRRAHAKVFGPLSRRSERIVWAGVVLTAVVLVLPGQLAFSGRIIVATFGWALILWLVSNIKDLYVALGAAVVVFVVGGFNFGMVASVMTNSATITIMAAFVIAAAVKEVGLVQHLSARLFRGPRRASSITNRLAFVNAATVAAIPATSARAALSVPLVDDVDQHLTTKQQRTTMSMVVPITILMSAGISLLGAGAHIISVELLQASVGTSVNFLQWILYCAPYAILSTAISVFVITRMFSSRADRREVINLPDTQSTDDGLDDASRRTLMILVAVIAGWFLSALFGFSPAVPAVIGAVAVIAPGVGAISAAQAFKSVPWDLVLFLCATLVLAEALISSGGASFLLSGVLGWSSAFTDSPWLIALIVVALSLMAHLVVNSRSARSSVLVPLIIPLAVATGLNPVALVLLSTLAAGYCITLPVCAKPLLMYSKRDEMGRPELLRLSAVLIPIHVALLMVFATLVWPTLGLPLTS